MAKNFGFYLRDLREKRGITQEELAIKSGITQAYISQLENGTKESPTVDVAVKLSDALSCNLMDLYAKEGTKKLI